VNVASQSTDVMFVPFAVTIRVSYIYRQVDQVFGEWPPAIFNATKRLALNSSQIAP